MRRLLRIAVVLVVWILPGSIVLAQSGDGPDQPARGNRLFVDDFTTYVNRWERLKSAKYIVDYDDFAYHFWIRSPGVTAWSTPDTDLDINRYRISVLMAFAPQSPPGTEAGIIFNVANDNSAFYAFGISPDGTYEVCLHQMGQWQEPPLAVGQVEPSTTYRIGVERYQNAFTLWINDTQVDDFTDESLSGGKFGLFAQAGRGEAHVQFDDYEVYDLDLGS